MGIVSNNSNLSTFRGSVPATPQIKQVDTSRNNNTNQYDPNQSSILDLYENYDYQGFQSNPTRGGGPRITFSPDRGYRPLLSAINFFDDIKSGAYGFTTYMNNTQFIGISRDLESFNPSLKIYESGTVSLYNQLSNGSIYHYTKNGAVTQKIFSSKGYHSGNRYSEYINSLGDIKSLLALRSIEKNSPSALDEQYMKFNLRKDSYNPSYPAQPFVLRGIQRIGNPEPQLWGVDGIRTEGVLSDTVGSVSTYIDRTLSEISRYSQWVVSPKGIVSLAKFGLFNLISAKNKAEQFAYARNRFTSYHDTYYKNDTALYSGVAILNDAKNAVSWTNTAAASTINFLKQDGASQTQDIKDFFADKKSEIKSYYTNRSLYRLYNETIGVEPENTNPAVAMNRLETSAERTKVDGFNPSIPNRNYATLAYSKIPKTKRSEKSFNDFRSDINKDINVSSYVGVTSSEYYKQNNLENKYGFGNLGKPGQDRSKPNSYMYSGSSWLHGVGAAGKNKDIRTQLANNDQFRGDRITATDIFSKNGTTAERLALNDFYPAGTTDLIKFWFEDADYGNNVMIFRSTITGLSDNFSPGWDRIETMGRPDGMYLYTSFERSISFEFRVAALSRSEMMPMWRKLNFLATYTMPDYGIGSWKVSGPFMRMTLGNLYWRQPGFISSLSYNFPDDTSWDIAEDYDDNKDAKQLPTVVDVSITYTLISDTRPRLMGRAYSLSNNNTIGTGNGAGQWLANAFND